MFGMMYMIVLHYNRVLLSYSKILGQTEKTYQVTNNLAYSICNELHVTVLHSGRLLPHLKIRDLTEKGCQMTKTLAYPICGMSHLNVLHLGRLLLHSRTKD
jgi:hypothetical protein